MGCTPSLFLFQTSFPMNFFVVDNIDMNMITLPPEESKHCVKVLRMTAGEELFVTDGNGTLCRCRILSPDARACAVEVVERTEEYGKRRQRLHIAIAPTKNTARLEWFIEKAVEIGIDEITPILCDHSERMVLKTERLDKIVVSAMKQSLKAYKPIVNEPVKMVDFLDIEHPGTSMICYCEGDQRVSMSQVYNGNKDALVLIGPEGDFSQREIEKALARGYHPVTLGTCRLRTETAALYSTVAANFIIDNQ